MTAQLRQRSVSASGSVRRVGPACTSSRISAGRDSRRRTGGSSGSAVGLLRGLVPVLVLGLLLGLVLSDGAGLEDRSSSAHPASSATTTARATASALGRRTTWGAAARGGAARDQHDRYPQAPPVTASACKGRGRVDVRSSPHVSSAATSWPFASRQRSLIDAPP